VRRSAPLLPVLSAVVACCLSGIADARRRPALCATAVSKHVARPYVAIVSAFPAEMAALVAATAVETAVEVDGRQVYVGALDGVRVVLALTGIGMVNARTRTLAVVDNFEVAGLIMSGVAGSPKRIGDVLLARRWVDRDAGDVFRTNPALLALARRGVTRLPAPFDTCAIVRDLSTVCLPYEPAVFFRGRGVSGDPFQGGTLGCQVGGTDIFGCELPTPRPALGAIEPAAAAPDVEDMETAAVARVAKEKRIPFLGVRAVSDGAGDPRGDRGFPAQFFDYYRLAADNAGIVTRAVVAELGRLATRRSSRETCRLLAMHRWRRAAARLGS
jgi:nucleoside phosphorylase